MKYAVVIERGATSHGATVPDLPGCVAVAETRDDVERLIEEAIVSHLSVLRELGHAIPEPQTEVTTIDVRPGSGRPIESHVRRPMMIGRPIVRALNRFKSAESRHGNCPPRPMTPFSETAAISETRVDCKLAIGH